ncbi:DUF4236 domain-containing protein [Thalassospira sp. MBR-102]|jgi:hypothetical protein|uniref:DUF4236 domain-containing protein n=1 Tax=Thalassospira sp. MBR-102 TaxID=3156466 RepID=UPI003398A8AB
MRFRKSFKIAPGIRVNVGSKQSSLSIGGKGFTTNFSKRGTRTTVGIPGSGLSHTFSHSNSPKGKPRTPKPMGILPPKKRWEMWRMIGYFFLIIFLVGFASSLFGN